MECKDPFKRLQKEQCPHDQGRKQGKRAVYGCQCCMPMNLSDFKKMIRKLAKARLKEETRQEVKEAILEMAEDKKKAAE